MQYNGLFECRNPCPHAKLNLIITLAHQSVLHTTNALLKAPGAERFTKASSPQQPNYQEKRKKQIEEDPRLVEAKAEG